MQRFRAVSPILLGTVLGCASVALAAQDKAGPEPLANIAPAVLASHDETVSPPNMVLMPLSKWSGQD